eukprot:GFUD01057608.1.p1 GENE.GFUD01057608.1~~GFUD01057608.1.p1  ORF type:complete len:193 (+),score=62.12 GFUD01057608.1:37-579(+)
MEARKKRQSSGDSNGSSGYGSAVESFHSEHLLNMEEAVKILKLNKSQGCPLEDCKIKTYPRILCLHEPMCKFPEVRNLTVRSKLNFFKAHGEKFNVFCQSFDKCRQVLFLYKKTKEQDSVRISVQHYGRKDISFTMTFYDKKDRHLHKIVGKTGLQIHLIPGKVFREVGPLVSYKIVMSK